MPYYDREKRIFYDHGKEPFKKPLPRLCEQISSDWSEKLIVIILILGFLYTAGNFILGRWEHIPAGRGGFYYEDYR